MELATTLVRAPNAADAHGPDVVARTSRTGAAHETRGLIPLT
jgi:hypothetical protein